MASCQDKSCREIARQAYCDEIGRVGARLTGPALLAGGCIALGYAVSLTTGHPGPAQASHHIAGQIIKS